MSVLLRAFVVLLGLAGSMAPPPAQAILDGLDFTGAVDEQRFRSVAGRLRCLVCQNESLLGSNAELANDLRDEIYALMTAGKSDAEVFEFMVARYGDFVLYEPPIKPTTYVLWFAPVAVFLLISAGLVRAIRRRELSAPPALAAAERSRASELLNAGDDAAPPG